MKYQQYARVSGAGTLLQAAVEREFQLIVDSLETEREAGLGALCSRRHAMRQRLVVGLGLVVAQQLTGVSDAAQKLLTVRPWKALKVMYVRGGQTCFGGFWGKKSYRDVR
jgi:hypothetical protein